MSLVSKLKEIKYSCFVIRKHARRWGATIHSHLSPYRRRIERQVRSRMTLPVSPHRSKVPGAVWGISMMRNEARLLPYMLEHCQSQGFDGLVVADNLSTDTTAEILKTWSGRMPVVYVDDKEELYLQQQKMDVLARVARRRGADWIVPFDADEFWYGAGGRTVAEILRLTPRDIGVQTARVHNVIWDGRRYMVGTLSDRLPKVAFRWHPLAHLHHGNHGVDRPGDTAFDLRILHFSYRSEQQFIGKIRHGAQALRYLEHDPDHPGHSWLDLNDMTDGELREVYAEMLQGRGPSFMDWIPKGEMVEVTPFPWAQWSLK